MSNSNLLFLRKEASKAFTLIEMLVVVGVLTIIIAIAVAALGTSKQDADLASAEARAKVLNEARDRAILKDLSLPNGAVASSREEWDAYFENEYPTAEEAGVAATSFLLEKGMVTIP